MAPASRRGPPKLYRQDMVRKAGSSGGGGGAMPELGAVMRTWHEEADSIAEMAELDEASWADLSRPLKDGEVGIFWQHTGEREILSEDGVALVDRWVSKGSCVRKFAGI